MSMKDIINVEEQQKVFKEMGAKILAIGKSLDNAKRKTLIFQKPENVLYDIFMDP